MEVRTWKKQRPFNVHDDIIYVDEHGERWEGTIIHATRDRRKGTYGQMRYKVRFAEGSAWDQYYPASELEHALDEPEEQDEEEDFE